MSLAVELVPNWLQRRIGYNLMKHTTERKFIRNIINCMITANTLVFFFIFVTHFTQFSTISVRPDS